MFEEDKRFRLKKQFCKYKKREINSLKKYPCKDFPCEISLCHRLPESQSCQEMDPYPRGRYFQKVQHPDELAIGRDFLKY